MEPRCLGRRIRVMRMRLLLVALVLLAGCDQRPQSTRTFDAKDPCGLLTPKQVEKAIGTPIGPEREVGSHDLVTRICSYDTSKPYASVGVVIETDVGPDDFERRMKRDPINTEPVDGVGEMAYIHGCSSLQLLAEETYVSMALQHLTTCEDSEEVLRAIAAEAIAELEET